MLDLGIDADHPDLAGSLIGSMCMLPEFLCPDHEDYIGDFPNPDHSGHDDSNNSHGTHVSGIITSDGNQPGVPKGIAPAAGIFSYKVLVAPRSLKSLDDFPGYAPIIAALSDIVAWNFLNPTQRYDFINMSFGSAIGVPGGYSNPDVCVEKIEAIHTLFLFLRNNHGTLPIAASGNNGSRTGIFYPACHPLVLSVGGVWDDTLVNERWNACREDTVPDKVACGSDIADILDVVAPGGVILSAIRGGGAGELTGTSMASPHAVGVAALLKQMLPGITADEIVAVLKETGVPVTDDYDPSNVRIFPRIDAKAAVLDHDFDGDGCSNYLEFVSVTDPEIVDCDSSVSDILVGSVNTGAGLFYCITNTIRNTITNAVQTFQQCNTDIEGAGVAPTTNTPPTWEDTCDTLEAANPGDCPEGSLNNASEPGADALAGPPPPPPYAMSAPSAGLGLFYANGAGVPAGSDCMSTDCTVVTTCFEDTGPIKGTGPNIIWTVTILNPNSGTTVQADTDGDTVKDQQVDRVSSGTVDIWYNQDIVSCDALTTKGDPDFNDLPLESIQAYDGDGMDVNPNPAPWRPGAGGTVLDFDGDGCTDEQELSGAAKCGDDPQNPSDSFPDPNTVDLSGVYDILVTVLRSDCTNDQCTGQAPGVYLFCRADLQHDMSNNDIVLRPYCYWDSVGIEINPEAYSGITGDGMAGAPPPGPQDANGSYAYGDVDTAHAELTGSFNKTTNNFEISGCIEDQDGMASGLGHVYVELTVSAHQLPGTTDIWLNQNLAHCQNGAAFGGYEGLHGVPTLNDSDLSMVQPNPNKPDYDHDGDGVPTERELQDDAACGRRDPYNKNDYYDVSIPRDGVIDLANDILGVIVHFAPGGYPPGDENWDRPRIMVGAGLGSVWNRGSPDGVIDLPNDILGVILQFNPGGCPPIP